jgi:hypothetical protein
LVGVPFVHAHPAVQSVDGDGADAYHRLAWARRGIGDLLEGERIKTAVVAQDDRSHRIS